MPTIFRQGGFDVRIRPRDHPPPHVHILYGREEVVINLGVGINDAHIRDNRGMRRANIRRAMDIVTANNSNFLIEWRRFYP